MRLLLSYVASNFNDNVSIVHGGVFKLDKDTMIQNQDTSIAGQKYSTGPRAQERVSERGSEQVSAAERASEANE